MTRSRTRGRPPAVDYLPGQQCRTEPRPGGPLRRISVKPLADLTDGERDALLHLCEHAAWAECCTFGEESAGVASATLDALVAAGHLLQIAKRARDGNRYTEAAYQLKPVSVVMAAEWRREHGG